MRRPIAQRAVTLPAKSVNQGAHAKSVRGPDFYPTPPELVIPFLLAAHTMLPGRIWEPAAGLGHMAEAIHKFGFQVVATDLYDYSNSNALRHPVASGPKFDFFKQIGAPRGVETIITNPPFGVANAFVRHALTLVDHVAILCRLSFLEGKARRDLIDGHLVGVYPFRERPRMMHRWSPDAQGAWREWQGKKAGSAMPVAWFLFSSEHSASPATMQRLSWRDTLKTTCAIMETGAGPRTPDFGGFGGSSASAPDVACGPDHAKPFGRRF